MFNLFEKIHFSTFRFYFQILTFLISVYGAVFIGSYAAEKISTALPALSCAYDDLNGAYCSLVPLQHQIDHRVGAAIVQAQEITIKVFIPIVFTLISFILFFLFLGKAFCAWVCPLGTLQEWLFRIGRYFDFQIKRITPEKLYLVRPIKWLVLICFVFLLPLLAGMGIASHTAGNPFCDVCPSRIFTTLFTANSEQIALKTGDGIFSLILSIAGNLIAGFIVISALTVRQPFCRVCPMLAMNAVARHFSLLTLTKKQHDKCDKCGVCSKSCPMDIPEIHHKFGKEAFTEDCTLCGRCVEFCPDNQIIKIKFGFFSIFSSNRQYYKRKIKTQTPDGDIKVVHFLHKNKKL